MAMAKGKGVKASLGLYVAFMTLDILICVAHFFARHSGLYKQSWLMNCNLNWNEECI